LLYGTAATDTGQLLITLERVIFMSQSKIKLNATEEVQEFVNAATRCDFDVDVYYNRFLIDAKSILGVLSLDLTKVLTVDCHGESKEFNRTLKKFAVA
jgi:phosphocarrier protein HPr